MRLFAELLCLCSLANALHVLNMSAHSATINLDEPPEDRYRNICTQYESLMYTAYPIIWDALIPKDLQPIIRMLPLEDLIPDDMQRELEGLWGCTNFTWAQQFVFNFLYEFVAYSRKSNTTILGAEKMCTTIVAWSEKEQRIVHGHNFDFSFADQFRNLSITYTFTKNGSAVYKCTSLIGTIGSEHCMALGKFGLSINERNDGYLLTNLYDILKKRAEVTYVLGKIMTQNSYKDAVAMAQTVRLDAPVYFILSGVGIDEGAVVTRNNSETVDTWNLDSSKGRWFILETNYDHWLPVPASDDRRDPGNKHMSALNASCSLKDMFEVLSMEPNLNLGTVWTGVCSASTDDYDIVVRIPITKSDELRMLE